MLISHLNVFLANQSYPRSKDIPEVLQPLILIVNLALILRMPLRAPGLLKDTISPPFAPPDQRLRSPEDNLTLWQWMTVSWMKPLMTIGKVRQLNEEDVWALAYEFQHRRLHDAFRDLRGSVIRRLIAANGIDLIITTLLGILDLLAGMRIRARSLWMLTVL